MANEGGKTHGGRFSDVGLSEEITVASKSPWVIEPFYLRVAKYAQKSVMSCLRAR